MNDMSSAIVPRSDQLNADTLLAGPLTVTIKDVIITGGQEQPVSIVLEETALFFRPCKSMSRVLVHAWGPDAKLYVGRSLTLYRDPTVKWGGLEVGGIRISHMSHIDGKMQMQLTATKGQRRPHVVLPLANVPATKPDKATTGTRDLIARLKEVGPGKMAEAILSSAEVVKQREYLASKRPELAAELDAAIAALGAADDSPFDTPRPAATGQGDAAQEDDGAAAVASQPEGRDESEMGENPTLDQAKSALDGCKSEDAVQTMLDSYRGQLSDEDLTALSIHANDIVAARWPV